MSTLTEPLNEIPDFEPKAMVPNAPAVQCSLCLHEISIADFNGEGKTAAWVQCPRCDYHQPLEKLPRSRDILLFGGVIGAVYLTTIVAILLTR